MHISEDDFARAIKIANEAGLRGKHVDVKYIEPTSATQDRGNFVVDEYNLTATGDRA